MSDGITDMQRGRAITDQRGQPPSTPTPQNESGGEVERAFGDLRFYAFRACVDKPETYEVYRTTDRRETKLSDSVRIVLGECNRLGARLAEVERGRDTLNQQWQKKWQNTMDTYTDRVLELDRAEQRVAELEKALRHIGEFAEAHHAEQPISALLHSLTVDIPHYVAVSLSPSTTQGTRDAG